MVQRCNRVPRGHAQRAAGLAAEHLARAAELRACHRMAAYASIPGELPSGPLVALAAARGMPLLWPRIVGTEIEFACARPEDLVPGRYAIAAPPAEVPQEALGPDVLLLVPGLAFDTRGGRLGRGRGYYDRILARPEAAAAIAIGVGYEFQRVEEVPMAAHDQRMRAVLTERGLYRCPAADTGQ